MITMAELDYRALGMKCGLEVHQQLDTGKLFCRCPSFLREDEPDIIVRRKLRPVASELGEFDPAALEAYRKGLEYVYEAYDENCCLIDLDEEPPKEADSDALDTILMVSLMFNSRILDEIFVMRKAVIDGSNTTGFQKTMLVATGGTIEYEGGSLGVQSIVLEEDAARPISRDEKEVIYRLDRLGIPLIELATDPGIRTPEEAGRAARAIGNAFRLTGRAKRGLGTIRQDLNVSIAKGARVEVKGVQKLDLIPEYVKKEVQRQIAIVEVKEELVQRGLKAADFDDLESKDVTGLLHNSESNLLQKGFEKDQITLAVKLPKLKGILGKEVQPGRRFGTEVASYLKAKAKVRGLIHSDELPNYGISSAEVQNLAKELCLGAEDAFGVVLEKQERAEAAIEVIIERCKLALEGVLEETRNALGDGNTEYSRPLPGAARMYPETDLAPVRISSEKINGLKKRLPKDANARKEQYMKFGLGEKLAEKMKLSNEAPLFEALVAEGHDATTVAALLLEGMVQLRRDGIDRERVSNAIIEGSLQGIKEGIVTKDVLLKVVREWSSTPEKELEEIVKGLGLEKADSNDVEKIIADIVAKNKKFVDEKGEHAIGALMGIAMKELRGKASGQVVSSLLKKEIAKVSGK